MVDLWSPVLPSAASSCHGQLCGMRLCGAAVWTSAAVFLRLRHRLDAPPQSFPLRLCSHLQAAVLPVSCRTDAIHREYCSVYAPVSNHLTLQSVTHLIISSTYCLHALVNPVWMGRKMENSVEFFACSCTENILTRFTGTDLVCLFYLGRGESWTSERRWCQSSPRSPPSAGAGERFFYIYRWKRFIVVRLFGWWDLSGTPFVTISLELKACELFQNAFRRQRWPPLAVLIKHSSHIFSCKSWESSVLVRM